MKKARILHLITRAAIGGSQDNTFCTCERHDRDRFEIHLACNPDGAWLDRARRAADFFHPVPSLVTPIRPFQDARALVEIIRILRRGRYDLVHTHTAKAGILGRIAARLCRVPVVVHTYHAFPWHDFMPAWRRGLYVLIERGCRPLTDFALTVSENERMEGLRRGVLRPDCSQTVYSGIDFSKLDAPVDVAGVRAGLGVPVGAPVVLMAGRLDPQKAPTLMVEAFVQVRRRHPGAVLWLAGDGELRPQVEASIRQHGLEGNVRVLGFRDDVPALLRAADVFALSSRWEGLGRAMTEAMLVGKPVVVPAINGIPEIVHHRDTGLLYGVGRVDELAARLNDLLDAPGERTRLGRNARELTRRLFAVETMVTQIEGIFDRFLASSSQRGVGVRPAVEGAAVDRPRAEQPRELAA